MEKNALYLSCMKGTLRLYNNKKKMPFTPLPPRSVACHTLLSKESKVMCSLLVHEGSQTKTNLVNSGTHGHLGKVGEGEGEGEGRTY